ncbi:DUF805 domain-containing protein [Microbacterium sp. SYP-A9085]|uniref:DUF805 domain-containing protein n=1 Tax=Microbacterium sp. SYP-A9085 TaxID=2664454 RepID=UPI001562825C|nr:DUF805 domain-containing protein [Microbacterium sp. SYP-A9085]
MTAHSGDRAPVPLDQPYYGATLPIAFTRFWRKYATFSGRASRSEFWWWMLCGGIVAAVIVAIYVPSLLAARTGHGLRWDTGLTVTVVLAGAWFVAAIVPSLALAWRRLHDANLRGLFWLLGLIPSVGWIMMLVLILQPTNPRGIRFDRAAA